MGFYGRFILPWVVHLACGTKPAMRQREKVVPSARGRVLEIGIGSGLNLAFYDPKGVECVLGLDPSKEMTRMAEKAAARVPFSVELVSAGSEAIPLEEASVDTVLTTFVLCTIPDATGALREMGRVLRPGGQLLFCEHGKAPDAGIRGWQDRVDPVWRRLAGGCHLNRDIPALLDEGGFEIRDLESMYIPGWRPASFVYRGRATAR